MEEEHSMRRSIAGFLLIVSGLFGIWPSAEALGNMGIGVHGGFGEYQGDVFQYSYNGAVYKSGDVGSELYYGGHLKVGSLGLVNIFLNVDYFRKSGFWSLSFPQGVPDSLLEFTNVIDFRDFSVSIDGKANILHFPGVPMSVYVGGGIGSHILNTEVSEAIPSEIPHEYREALSFFEDNGRWDGHGCVGATAFLPSLSMELFVEGRYAIIKTRDEDKGRKDDLVVRSIMAGVTLKFQ
jgi:hypothetical protein